MLTKKQKRIVSIVQRMLPHYRVDFFNLLRDQAAQRNIEIILIYGNPNLKQSFKKDDAILKWAIQIKNKEIHFNSFTLFWQPCLKYIRKSDLIIVEQANKNLLNYILLVGRIVSGWKVAFWGHGRNLQKEKNSIANIFKYKLLKSSDWWFAYTESVKNFLFEHNYPLSRITVVQNTINTYDLKQHYEKIQKSDVDKLKFELKIHSENIALFCGAIYPNKRIDFLIDAAGKIKDKIKDFHLIIIGGGESFHQLADLINGKEWIHYIGTKFGRDKVIYYKMSKVFLMPGLVGLSIVDSFALRTPLITTDFPYHSPEISYLINGVNGVVTINNVEDYSEEVIKVLIDNDYLNKLKRGCVNSSKKYSMEVMVENFLEGIERCLNQENINN